MATLFPNTGNSGYQYGDINTLDGTVNLSICIWIYQTASQNNGAGTATAFGMVGKTNQAGEPLYFFKTNSGGGTVKAFAMYDGTGSVATQANTALDDVWQHVGITYNGANGAGSRGAIYIAGLPVTTSADTLGAAMPSNASNVMIGSVGGLYVNDGCTLAHCKIWQATLTASEMLIESKYAEPQRMANLVIYAPLMFNSEQGATYDGTNALTATINTPATATVSEPPVIWPASTKLSRNVRRISDGQRRNRFQRLPKHRPLVQYG